MKLDTEILITLFERRIGELEDARTAQWEDCCYRSGGNTHGLSDVDFSSRSLTERIARLDRAVTYLHARWGRVQPGCMPIPNEVM